MSSLSELDAQTRKAIEQTRSQLTDARHLPGFYYTSPEIYRREIDTIFMREWLFVGRVEEFEHARDYLHTAS